MRALPTAFRDDERNNLQFQRAYWTRAIVAENGDKTKLFGYGWGDPDEKSTKDDSGAILGNYLFVKEHYLLPKINNAVVLEIGSGGGKWTQYMRPARKIICVDLSREILDCVRERLGWNNLRYYETSGDELRGIKSNSIDFIFSMDALVRTPALALKRYFQEVTRVLKNNGEICLHLPCKDKTGSVARNFVKLSENDIKKYCRDNNLGIITLDRDNLAHGVILLAKKAGQ